MTEFQRRLLAAGAGFLVLGCLSTDPILLLPLAIAAAIAQSAWQE